MSSGRFGFQVVLRPEAGLSVVCLCMTMPRYHFVIHAPDQSHDDPEGMMLPDRDAAKEHGHRVVGETKGRWLPSTWRVALYTRPHR
jgi:hypothetical protein